MGKPTGFLEFTRELPADRSPLARVADWREFLQVSGLGDVPLVQMDHDLAHAAGAYWMSGWERALVITCDGVGALLRGHAGPRALVERPPGGGDR